MPIMNPEGGATDGQDEFSVVMDAAISFNVVIELAEMLLSQAFNDIQDARVIAIWGEDGIYKAGGKAIDEIEGRGQAAKGDIDSAKQSGLTAITNAVTEAIGAINATHPQNQSPPIDQDQSNPSDQGSSNGG